MRETDKEKASQSITSSELDELTHSELLMLYQESAESIRFQKLNQWRCFYGAILLIVGLIIFGEFSLRRLLGFSPWIIIATTSLTALMIYVIIVYHMLQNLERQKLRKISAHLSDLTRDTRQISSQFESTFHRYSLLIIMLIILIGACAISVILMARHIN